MKLGMLTACLPDVPLDQIAAWASSHGYQGLEVAAWPRQLGRDWEASHIDVANLDQDGATDVDRLHEGGFDGFVSVEHEDPVWSGSPDKVQQGLVLAQRTLSPLLVD